MYASVSSRIVALAVATGIPISVWLEQNECTVDAACDALWERG